MPKKIDPAIKERALRMVSEHRGEYASLTACCDQVGRRLGLSKETARRWALHSSLGYVSPIEFEHYDAALNRELQPT